METMTIPKPKFAKKQLVHRRDSVSGSVYKITGAHYNPYTDTWEYGLAGFEMATESHLTALTDEDIYGVRL